MRFRSKSAARARDEMIALAQRYKTLEFQVVDNIIELRYIRELLPHLRDTGWDWRLFYETKANLTKDQLRLFREAGIREIQPGIESLSTPILKLMRKGITGLQNIRLLKWCAELEIHPHWNLIYGFPGEPPEEYEHMAKLARSLVHFTAPSTILLAIERFSPYHEAPHEHGIEILGPACYYPAIYPECDRAELTDLAYSFDWRHEDGRDVGSYVSATVDAMRSWREAADRNKHTLCYVRGPEFLTIREQRTTMEPARYEFDEPEAAIYLACDAGASPGQVHKTVRDAGHTDYSVDEIREFLDSLVEQHLVHREKDRYLGLAIARDPLQALRARQAPSDAEPSDAAPSDAAPKPQALVQLGRSR
jgi:ribosomal peptide maturation radical SAM protein 1